MATVRVPDDGSPTVTITEGGETIVYKVKDGEIVTDDAHAAAILGAVAGSTLKPEAPAKTKSETPAKET